ncbi:conserved hypothetical protein [Xenorhabdus nematophila F1]|nr:conserved hypothetical protein [Xenorhabdus nematophila F1]CEE93276.1 hypothetical protein XNA1_3550029 [Xenorhabdus nematophila str. Anatoliense]CEF31935.1 hypothetical protein XNW1_4160030 [Xenorhabdus nematophila str. Websteri]CEK23131.1 hypothetical protein XNC2_2137 [Xenorhabdus nematophila AN6/1]CEE96074.1 hypothetical protein XNA1_950029 [Xenorhabdus nematophila str. Anatoliense]
MGKAENVYEVHGIAQDMLHFSWLNHKKPPLSLQRQRYSVLERHKDLLLWNHL